MHFRTVLRLLPLPCICASRIGKERSRHTEFDEEAFIPGIAPPWSRHALPVTHPGRPVRTAPTARVRMLSLGSQEVSPTAPWASVVAASAGWAASRKPRAGDVPLVLYRDANSWCPFCHRVFFFMEQKQLRYVTECIHLGGDPREPPKKLSYLRDIAPRGNVPALRIRDEVVLESLDILHVLDREFPDTEAPVKTAEDKILEGQLVRASGAFDTDCDDWLHNTDRHAEPYLRLEALEKLQWLEGALSARPAGPFFFGERVTLADAAFVGFLTRLATNYAYFKGLDVRKPSAGYPLLSAWLQAIDGTPGGVATKQDPCYEQRVYQAHPDRRAAAEPCMELHPTRLGIGEPAEYEPPTPPESILFKPGSDPALEAAWTLSQRRDALVRFLLRKQREAAEPPLQHHWKMSSRHAPEPPPAAEEAPADLVRIEQQLLGLASVLTGQHTPAEGAHLAGGVEALKSGPVAGLGRLVGTPRDMTAAAASELRAGLREMLMSGVNP